MKKHLLLLALLVAAASLHAEVTLCGFVITGEQPYFALESEDKKQSGWITIGETFNEYKIVAFDRKAELLVVEKAGKQQSLRLRDLIVKEGTLGDGLAGLAGLKGVEWAVELAREDPSLADLLERYRQANSSLDPNVYAVSFLRDRIEKSGDEILGKQGRYRLKPGDTGMKIAKKAGLTLGELSSINPGVQWNRLLTGQIIRVRKPE